jgi:hypothetical protein
MHPTSGQNYAKKSKSDLDCEPKVNRTVEIDQREALAEGPFATHRHGPWEHGKNGRGESQHTKREQTKMVHPAPNVVVSLE